MDTLEITSLSTKGQIVIPRSIRNQLNLDTGDKLIVVCDGTNILLKPVLMPSMSEFKTLVDKTRPDSPVPSLQGPCDRSLKSEEP